MFIPKKNQKSLFHIYIGPFTTLAIAMELFSVFGEINVIVRLTSLGSLKRLPFFIPLMQILNLTN